MNILKYIITVDQIPVIFSATFRHNEILNKGVSAGYLILNYDVDTNIFVIKCFGESTSLELKVAQSDERLITEYLNKQFYNLSNVTENYNEIRKY